MLELLTDFNLRTALLGNVLLSAISGLIGVLAYWQRKSLTTDAVSHAILPGICLGYMVTGQKDPLFLAVGALLVGLVAILIVDKLSAGRRRQTDAPIALVLSTFFGLGIFLLTLIQHQSTGSQSGLDKFLFGKAATILSKDLITFSYIGLAALVLTVVFYGRILYSSFDAAFVRSVGIPVQVYQTLVSVLIVTAVVIGLQSVGVVLMSAMIIAPVAGALFFTNKHQWMAVVATLLAALGGLAGVLSSYYLPAVPTGPAIVIVLGLIAFGASLLGPQGGYLIRNARKRRMQRQMADENALKAMYRSVERTPDPVPQFTEQDLIFTQIDDGGNWAKVLGRLAGRGYLARKAGVYTLTQPGFAEGKRITLMHRNWELFLSNVMNIAPDHVHDDAESIEHFITPEIEQKLEEYLRESNRQTEARASAADGTGASNALVIQPPPSTSSPS